MMHRDAAIGATCDRAQDWISKLGDVSGERRREGFTMSVMISYCEWGRHPKRSLCESFGLTSSMVYALVLLFVVVFVRAVAEMWE
jgi:hypothetical protein